ncbi:MAG: FAD-binding protein [Deltaproteobacteria bacterium]|nr:FAD-binding protein [Deltaproteobacteria bacterium]
MLDRKLYRRLEEILGPENISARVEDLHLYAYDGTGQVHLPEAVAWPGTTAQVAALVTLAAEHGLPVVARGAGSGMTGGALPIAGGVVCVMTRFNRIIKIDTVNLTAVVEPGVITADFQAAVEKEGLFYPPDPASREFSTLGGNAAENAGGTRAVKYGVTRDYILGLEVVLGTGEIIQTGVQTPKGVVGYDLTRLLVGSEGTLGIITRLTMRLLPRPEAKETMLAFFARLSGAAETVAAITAARIIPSTLEFMDRASLDCVKDYASMEVDPRAGAMLLIETDGPLDQARAEAHTITDLCQKHGAQIVRQAKNSAEAEAMWQARRAISPALAKVATGKLNEDIVVPRSLIPDMIARLEDIGRHHGLNIINFGHAGDGNIHTNIMYDAKDQDQTAAAQAALKEVFSATLELGGTISGEHGIGITKAGFIGLEVKPAALALMKRLKTAFDPKGILNPGKIFPASDPRDDLH